MRATSVRNIVSSRVWDLQSFFSFQFVFFLDSARSRDSNSQTHLVPQNHHPCLSHRQSIYRQMGSSYKNSVRMKAAPNHALLLLTLSLLAFPFFFSPSLLAFSPSLSEPRQFNAHKKCKFSTPNLRHLFWRYISVHSSNSVDVPSPLLMKEYFVVLEQFLSRQFCSPVRQERSRESSESRSREPQEEKMAQQESWISFFCWVARWAHLGQSMDPPDVVNHSSKQGLSRLVYPLHQYLRRARPLRLHVHAHRNIYAHH
jgi:hypothetical protein